MKHLLRFFDQLCIAGRVSDGWKIAGVLDDSNCTALTSVRNFEQQIVVIITTAGIVPSNQVLIQVVHIAANVWERVTTKLELGNVCEYFWIRAEIDVLRVSFRLQKRRGMSVRQARRAQNDPANIPDIHQ
jgi:hypothetical protein